MPIDLEILTKNMNISDEVLADEVLAECARQVEKWGVQNHALEVWYAILGEEFGEVGKAILDVRFDNKLPDNYREELIQVAAVAISMIASFDRGNNGATNL